MMTVIVVIHMIICILLIGIILIQAGRGGGLVEGFSGVESMFGTKTNSFLTRSTTVLAILFFITCLTLAVLSARQGKSLMRQAPAAPEAGSKVAPEAETPKSDTAAKAQETPAPAAPAQATKTN